MSKPAELRQRREAVARQLQLLAVSAPDDTPGPFDWRRPHEIGPPRAREYVVCTWGRTVYKLRYQKRAIEKFAKEVSKMKARYFEIPFEILAPGDS